MRIAIGSANPVKIRAAQTVLAPLYEGAMFIPVEVDSQVRTQPWGDSETRTGAINRARAALNACDADLSIGFEGGVVETEIGLMLSNWAAVAARNGQIGVGNGGGLLLPPEVAHLLLKGVELGAAMDQLTGSHNTKQGEGAAGILTNGLINRQAAYEYTLRTALAPFRSPQWYTSTQGEH